MHFYFCQDSSFHVCGNATPPTNRQHTSSSSLRSCLQTRKRWLLSLSLAQSPGLAPRRRQPSPTMVVVPRENNRTSLSSRTGSRSRNVDEFGGIRERVVASRCCYDSVSVDVIVDKCCCYCCAVVAPKCPPPPIYMFMFRSRRATLTKRLTKAARKRRPPGGGADDCAASANLDNLLRQLQDNQMEMLLRAVERGGGDCVLVRKERSPSPPHLLCCQTWRWPEVRQASELRRLPSCRSASDPVYVCCNPYHWSRLCQPGMCAVRGECACVCCQAAAVCSFREVKASFETADVFQRFASI